MAVTISFKQTVEGILARLEACSTPLTQNEIENIIIQEKNMMMVQQIDFANGGEFCSFMDNLVMQARRTFANGPLTQNEIIAFFKNVRDNLPPEKN